MRTALNDEFYSIDDNNPEQIDFNKEIMEDRNIYTGYRYKNIFELRHYKLKYLIDDLPRKVKNYVFIKYEDLVDNFENTLNKIKNAGLNVKSDINFPLNTIFYKNNKNIIYNKDNKINYIDKELIMENPNLIKLYEIQLGYEN
jgi:hypothetical protein